MPEDIVYIRLINGDQIVGRLCEEQTETDILVSFPMMIENKVIDGQSAVNLIKYLPFTNIHQQVAALRKDHIVTINETNTDFSRYYTLSLEYYLTYIEPHATQNIRSINMNLECALEQTSQRFVDAMDKYADRIPSNTSSSTH